MESMRRLYDAWNRGDLDALAELIAPDATLHPLDYWPESQTRHGREEILSLLTELRKPLERNEAPAENVVEAGDRLVAAHLWRGLLRGTEDEVEARVGMTLTFREGKIIEARFFRTFDEALEAAGLRE